MELISVRIICCGDTHTVPVIENKFSCPVCRQKVSFPVIPSSVAVEQKTITLTRETKSTVGMLPPGTYKLFQDKYGIFEKSQIKVELERIASYDSPIVAFIKKEDLDD